MITHDQLMKFCGDNDVRAYINQPFTHNEKVYATNGHIVVRVEPNGTDYPKAYEYSNPDPVTKSKNLAEVIERQITENKPRDTIAIPEWDHIVPQPETCGACDDDCYYLAREFPTQETIKVLCEECEGSKTIMPRRRPVSIGTTYIDAKYLALIESLPNPRISLPDNSTSPVPFVFDGGIGLVMPIRVK